MYSHYCMNFSIVLHVNARGLPTQCQVTSALIGDRSLVLDQIRVEVNSISASETVLNYKSALVRMPTSKKEVYIVRMPLSSLCLDFVRKDPPQNHQYIPQYIAYTLFCSEYPDLYNILPNE